MSTDFARLPCGDGFLVGPDQVEVNAELGDLAGLAVLGKKRAHRFDRDRLHCAVRAIYLGQRAAQLADSFGPYLGTVVSRRGFSHAIVLPGGDHRGGMAGHPARRPLGRRPDRDRHDQRLVAQAE